MTPARSRSSESTSRIMRAIRSKNTEPELIVRRALRRMGVGYRLHRRDVPGRPDIALIGRRRAFLVHGCFWHQHADPNCPLVKTPKTNSAYWLPKLARTRARDALAENALRDAGWRSLVIWECELKDLASLEERLRTFLVAENSPAELQREALGTRT